MSPDLHDSSTPPLLNAPQRTTKVSVGVVIAVIFFFLLAGATILRVMRDPPRLPAAGSGQTLPPTP